MLVMNGTGDGESDEAITFSQHLACTHCGISFEEPAPRSFSFNSPYGACPVVPRPRHQVRGRPRAGGARRLAVPGRGCAGAVGGSPQRVLHRAPAGCGGLRRLLLRHPVEVAQGEGQEAGPLRHRQPGGARHLQEPLQPDPLLRGALRRHHPVAAAAPRRVGVRLVARADRAVHARGGLPRVQGRAPQARVARRHGRRAQHLRAVQPLHRRRGRGHGGPGADATAST